MSKTHWKQLQQNEWLGAYALPDGDDLTLTIQEAKQETVTGNGGKREMCLTIHWVEKDYLPMICNRTNARTITKVVGSPYIEEWKNRQITLYVDSCRLGPDIVECLRVRPYAPRATDKALKCAECGKDISGKGSMSASEVAAYTKRTFGKQLCSECAKKTQEG